MAGCLGSVVEAANLRSERISNGGSNTDTSNCGNPWVAMARRHRFTLGIYSISMSMQHPLIDGTDVNYIHHLDLDDYSACKSQSKRECALTLSHPQARDDLGTIAGDGIETGLRQLSAAMEMDCKDQMDSNSSVSSTASSGTGVPPMSEIPEIPETPEMYGGEDELYASESDGSRGDSRAISGRRTSTWMGFHRSGSMTDFGSDVLRSNHEDSPLLLAVPTVVCSASRSIAQLKHVDPVLDFDWFDEYWNHRDWNMDNNRECHWYKSFRNDKIYWIYRHPGSGRTFITSHVLVLALALIASLLNQALDRDWDNRDNDLLFPLYSKRNTFIIHAYISFSKCAQSYICNQAQKRHFTWLVVQQRWLSTFDERRQT
ncbi:hypothetical protein C8R42DRAFT_638741 [Lentinula raphanica]|nr:hypothetical protein C8R42DRAFT_638741 [Lentinula raphanica]KAJ3756689.1 hypothetical protein EV360DRAFT_71769 [Lentinula raphanica]